MRRVRSRTASSCAVTLALGLLAAGCSVGTAGSFPADPVTRPAANAPERFVVGSYDGTATEEPSAGRGCRSPMVDPRDGTRLRLVRSAGERGDYEAPAGWYGAGEGELLRIDCATGEVVGIVER